MKKTTDLHTFSNGKYTYNVKILWKLAPKTQWIKTTTLKTKNLYQPVWGNNHPTPAQLLKTKTEPHWTTTLKADLRFAIILAPDLSLMDGYHRLTKALYLKKPKIKARLFTHYDQLAPALITPDKKCHHPD